MASRKKTRPMTSKRTRAAAGAKRRPAARKTAPAKARSSGLALQSVAPIFTVGDLDKSLAYYRDVLGFGVGERWESDGRLMGVEMSAGPVIFMLTQDDWK